MSPTVRHPIRWRRHLKAAFTEHLALKGSSVLLAVVMWFLVAAREPKQEWIPVRFTPQLDSALVLRDSVPTVQARVVGSANEILKLSTRPLIIRRPVATDVPDTLVLSLRTSDVEIPEGVEVIVRDVQPRSLTLRFESTTSRVVPVRSAVLVQAPTGAPAVLVRLDPDSVTVLGPRRMVARLRFISTEPDTIPVDTLPHLVDLDTAGLGVVVRPPQVKAIFVRARP